MRGNGQDASAIFVALLEVGDKDTALIDAVTALRDGSAPMMLFPIDELTFRQIPASPFAYWTTDSMRDVFQQSPLLESGSRTAKQGLATADDFRFLRVWWEAKSATERMTRKWIDLAKGGVYSRYHSDLHLVIDWEDDGERIKAHVTARYPYLNGNWRWVVKNSEVYFRPGLTWTHRSQRGFTARASPSDCIFSHMGPAVFLAEDDPKGLLTLLAIMNSAPFRALLDLQMSFGTYEVGVIQRTPVPDLSPEQTQQLAALGLEAYSVQRQRDLGDETTHVFARPALVAAWSGDIATSAARIAQEAAERARKLADLQAEIDAEAAAAYGLALADLAPAAGGAIVDAGEDGDEDAEEAEDEGVTVDPAAQVEQLLQWVLGVVLGRWDLRMAHEPALLPALQGPFDPLPVCAPGALVGPDGLPARPGGIASETWLRARPSVIALPPESSVAEPTIPDAAYPLRIDWDGILVDDDGHPDDIVVRVREVLGLLWGERAEAIEAEACAILGVGDLREYLRNPRRFWEFHVKRYSKSRRKAPIYWLLQSAKRNYALWLYYPRLDADSLYKALRTYVDPKIARERNRLEVLEAERAAAEAAGTRARREHERAVDRQRALLGELEEFRQILERVARHDLTVDHDDGVLLSIAPLHELVPWKPAAQAWRELSEGKYGWSTMAQRMAEKGLTRGGSR